MRRLITTVLVVAMIALATAGVASADPKTGEFIEVTCTDGIPGGRVASPPNEQLWPPGMAVDGTGVYVVYGLEVEAIFHPDDGGDPVDLSGTFMKNPPQNTTSHLHGTCSWDGSEVFEDPDLGTGLIEFEATAYVFWTGR